MLFSQLETVCFDTLSFWANCTCVQLCASNENEEYKIVYSDELILLNENDYLCYICVPNEDMRVSWDNPEISIGVADKKMRNISGSKESIGTYTITATNDSTGEQYIFNIKK